MSSRVGASQGIDIPGRIGYRIQDDKAPLATDRDFDQGAAAALRVVVPDVAEPADAHDRVVYFLLVQLVTAGEFLGCARADDQPGDPERRSHSVTADRTARPRGVVVVACAYAAGSSQKGLEQIEQALEAVACACRRWSSPRRWYRALQARSADAGP